MKNTFRLFLILLTLLTVGCSKKIDISIFRALSVTNTPTPTSAPTVTSVSLNAGALGGGTSITITGTNFGAGATVIVGGLTCTAPTVNSATSITCTTPAHAAGVVSVTVTNTDTLSGSAAAAFTYQAAPSFTSISPAAGLAAGGDVVTITGTGFLTAATVSLGGSVCSVTAVTATIITCTTAAHAIGGVAITITNTDAQTVTSGSSVFSYITIPTVTMSADRSPLIVSAKSSLGVFTHTWSPIAETGTGQYPVGGTNIGGAGVANSGAVVATDTSSTKSPIGTVPALIKAPDPVNFTISGSSSLTDWGCSFLAPLTASCSDPGFSLTATQLLGVSSLISTWTHNVNNALVTSSNGLGISRIVVREVSNTANNSNMDDDARKFYLWGTDIYFSSTDSSGNLRRMFKLNTTNSTISQITQIDLDSQVSRVPYINVVNNKLLFWANNSSFALKLFSYDGASTVTQLSNFSNDQTSNDTYSGEQSFVTIGSTLYFVGHYNTHNHIYAYDGTTFTRTTNIVGPIDDVDYFYPYLLNYNNTIIFNTEYSGSTHYLTSYNPTGPVVTKLSSFTVSRYSQQLMGPVNGKYYLIGNANLNMLVTTDFTSFQILSDTVGAAKNWSTFANPLEFPNTIPSLGNWIYFTAKNPNLFYKCYRTDGVTVELFLNNLGNTTNEPCTVVPFGSSIYIAGYNALGKTKLFSYNGTTLQQIADTSGSSTLDDTPTVLGYFSNELYFSAKNAGGFIKLYKYDGTNTIQLTDLYSGGDDAPADILQVGDYIYFSAQKAAGVRKLYRLCDKSFAGCTD